MHLKFRKLILAALALTCLSAQAATSVTQYGITWHFDRDYQAGQFANGDWWVKESSLGAGVVITEISPRSSGGRNGSMLDPLMNSGANGFDSRMPSHHSYDASKNIATQLPYTVVPNPASSILSSISAVTSDSINNLRPALDTIAVLTVVREAPRPGSFRPPYQGDTDKSIRWNVDQIDYGQLGNFPRLSSTPSQADALDRIDRPYIFLRVGWTGGNFHPRSNMRPYGRDLAHDIGAAALALQVDDSNSDKRDTLVAMIQLGIDVYGSVENGASWYADGGHHQGRKLPMLIAGKALNDSQILSKGRASNIFQEDQQTFFVAQSDVNLSHVGVNSHVAVDYSSSDIGLPEWGIRHSSRPVNDSKSLNATYRSVSGAPTFTHAVAAMLMGLEEAWSHPAFFDYYHRYRSLGVPGAGPNGMSNAAAQLYDAYSGQSSSPNSETPPNPTPEPSLGRSPTPLIQPPSGSYLEGPIVVSIAGEGNETDIYYTLDGTTPTANSPRYTGPITIDESAELNAVSVSAGMEESYPGTASFKLPAFEVISDWQSAEFPSKIDEFDLFFEVVANDDGLDGVIGMANGEATGYTDLGPILRLNVDGSIDARDGGVYRADTVFPYAAGDSIRVHLAIDVREKTYTARVANGIEAYVTIASNYAFRNEQQQLISLDHLGMFASAGSLTVENFSFVIKPAAPTQFILVE